MKFCERTSKLAFLQGQERKKLRKKGKMSHVFLYMQNIGLADCKHVYM